MLLLAESHLAIHTWPERSAVTLDVYVCNFMQDNSGKARDLLEALLRAFRPGRLDRQQLHRGRFDTNGTGYVLEALDPHSVYGFRFERRLMACLVSTPAVCMTYLRWLATLLKARDAPLRVGTYR